MADVNESDVNECERRTTCGATMAAMPLARGQTRLHDEYDVYAVVHDVLSHYRVARGSCHGFISAATPPVVLAVPAPLCVLPAKTKFDEPSCFDQATPPTLFLFDELEL